MEHGYCGELVEYRFGINTSDSAFNTVEKIGGEKTHTLSINEMPSHNHNFENNTTCIADVGSMDTEFGWHADGTHGYRANAKKMLNTGGGQAHNNLQPYITCYMWKRTA